MTRFFALIFLFLFVLPLFGQSNYGELRLKVSDSSGAGLRSTVQLTSEANDYQRVFLTDEPGQVVMKHLPFGLYRLQVQHQGFAPTTQTIEIRSAIPIEYPVTLAVAPVKASVTVTDADTLIDPYAPSTINRIGSETIEKRVSSLPGRSIPDLVNTQPGWLFEGNAVLHPRGSEYQTQFVLDGMPLTDNRSPSFGPELAVDDVQSLNIFTAGIPAEYGRKMGGIVEVNTARDTRAGLHGQVVLSGGSFTTAGGFAQLQYGSGKNTFGFSADGDRTDRYLNPPVLENFTNRATTGDFSASYERELTEKDRISVRVRHELSRFLVPNELIQQDAGQRQDHDSFETMGLVSYQHIFNPNVIADLRGMVRDNSNDLSSNPLSTPVIAFQRNSFREGYFKGTVSIHQGRQEWKAGVESDSILLHENFRDQITDPSQFDNDTPATFSFAGSRPDLEQSAFLQDLIRLGKWTINAGLRWDHYQLLLNRQAFSPRISLSRYFPSADLVIHASYDRVFQTPEFENILLSSSPDIVSLSDQVLRLPVEPSRGNYYEVGVTKGFFQKLRLDVNYYQRRVNNFADDDQLLDTAVSFPIAFKKASIYGAEGKLELPHWGRLSGYISYSYMVGTADLPVTGGLFLGDDAQDALDNTNGRFWLTQDQRHTIRSRFRYQIAPRLWAAVGGDYGTGLPFEFVGVPQDAVDQFGQAIVNRVNFDTGRIKPLFSLNASLGADLIKTERCTMRIQADADNLNNRLNLIDFAGLFSGNAIGPPRSYALRLTTSF